MKYLLVFTALVMIGCQSQTSAEKESETTEVTEVSTFNAEGAPTVEFSVPSMHCEFSCAPAVKETLAKQPGVKDVKVDLATKTAVVSVEEDLFDAEAAVAALVDIQFVDSKIVNDGDLAKSTTADEKS
ncbi:MAG: heavy-metal-associated domain-containing protein [Lacipirellulaceae bacterium]